jgi:hypothetical protein
MRNLLLTIVLIVFSACCYSQTESLKPVEPKAIGQVYLLDESAQTMKELPSERWKDATHSHGWPIRTDVSCSVFPGAQSAFRVKATDRMEFVFKVGNPEGVTLYPAIKTKKERRVDYSESTYPKYDDKPIPGIAIEVSQYGQSSYKLVPKSPLAPGEYVINAGTRVFTFGVD